MTKRSIIAIDGPAGAGKSTVARLAAEGLNYTYIDTGAMYRAITYYVLKLAKKLGVKISPELVEECLDDVEVSLLYENKKTSVYLNGEEVSEYIRTPEVSQNVAMVAKIARVREKMLILQRQMAERGAVIMDGRDIATNVLPSADVKIFLTASIEERAKRRYNELKAKGYKVDLEELKQDIAKRDKEDSEREIAPLVKAKEATLLDTTGMSIEEVVQRILEMARGK